MQVTIAAAKQPEVIDFAPFQNLAQWNWSKGTVSEERGLEGTIGLENRIKLDGKAHKTRSDAHEQE